jgi:hypothetical protein
VVGNQHPPPQLSGMATCPLGGPAIRRRSAWSATHRGGNRSIGPDFRHRLTRRRSFRCLPTSSRGRAKHGPRREMRRHPPARQVCPISTAGCPRRDPRAGRPRLTAREIRRGGPLRAPRPPGLIRAPRTVPRHRPTPRRRGSPFPQTAKGSGSATRARGNRRHPLPPRARPQRVVRPRARRPVTDPQLARRSPGRPARRREPHPAAAWVARLGAVAPQATARPCTHQRSR